ISFTICRNENEDNTNFPMMPIKAFHTIYNLVCAGTTLNIGMGTRFAPGFLSSQDMNTLIYVRQQALPGVHLSKDTLHAVLVTDEEYEVCKNYGILRLLGKRGYKEKCFPFPPWNERICKSVVTMADFKTSIINHILSTSITGASVTKLTGDQAKECIMLQISPSSHEMTKKFIEQVGTEKPIAIFTGLDDNADSCLIWQSGLKQPTAISLNDISRRLAGCFILFCPAQDKNQLIMIEDGFSLILTNETYYQLCEALCSCKTFSASIDDNTQFKLVWKAMSDELKPLKKASRNNDIVKMDKMVLLTGHEMTQRITINSLANYVDELDMVVVKHFSSMEKGDNLNLHVVVLVNEDKSVNIQFQKNPQDYEKASLDKLQENLKLVNQPEVYGGPISFRLDYHVWE
ncbi:13136_t:CDS:1, partial [Ambispora leptoticha]